MFNPYRSKPSDESESESENESKTEPETESDLTEESADEQMDGLTLWREAAQSRLPQPVRSSLPPTGIDLSEEMRPALHDVVTGDQFHEHRVTSVVMVDSLDRDQQVWPSPTVMALKLPRVYKNIERIDIVQVKFFCGYFMISAARKNNTIKVSDAALPQTISNSFVVTIPDGTYSLQQMINTLSAALTAASNVVPGTGKIYTVTYSSTTGRFTISATGSFTIFFKSGVPYPSWSTKYSEWGLGWNLGWGGQPADISSNPPVLLGGLGWITADHFPRLSDDYIYLQLTNTKNMNTVDHTGLENTKLTQESGGQVAHYFGKLLLNNFGCWAQTFVEAPKIFKPVEGQLEQLYFTWTDRNGRTLAWPGATSCDWHMTLRITEVVVDVPVD